MYNHKTMMHTRPANTDISNLQTNELAKVDMGSLLIRKNLPFNLFNKENNFPELFNLEAHIKFIYKTIYSIPYPGASSNEIPRRLHGIMHATRVAIYINVLANFCKKYGFDKHRILSHKNIALLQIAASLHDAAREEDGVDKWDNESGLFIYFYLTRKLGIDISIAKKIAEMTANKDIKKNGDWFEIIEKDGEVYTQIKPIDDWSGLTEDPYFLFLELIQAADAMDITRIFEFNITYLKLYERILSNENAMHEFQVIMAEIKQLLQMQGDNSCNNDNAYLFRANENTLENIRGDVEINFPIIYTLGFFLLNSDQLNFQIKNNNETESYLKSAKLSIASRMCSFSQVIRQLKEVKNNSNGVIGTNVELMGKNTLSLRHMQVVLGNEYDPQHISKNIEVILNRYFPETDILSENGKRLVAELTQCIKREMQNQETKIYFYHGCNEEISFLYDLITAIYQILNSSNEQFVPRFRADYFESTPDVMSLMNRYEAFNAINNFELHFADMAISVNMSLFGNISTLTSCSMYYMIDNYSIAKDELFEKLKKIFGSFIPEGIINEAINFYIETKINSGAFYQIEIPHEIASNISYLSSALGVKFPYEDSTDTVLMFRKMLVKSEPDASDDAYLEKVQARLMVPPHLRFSTTKVRLKERLDVGGYRKGLTDIAQTFVKYMLVNIGSATRYIPQNVALVSALRQATIFTNINNPSTHDKRYNPNSELIHAVKTNNDKLIIELIAKYPYLLEDKFKLSNVSSYVVNNLDLFSLIFQYSYLKKETLCQLLIAYIDKEIPLPNDITYIDFQNAFNSLPDEYHLSFLNINHNILRCKFNSILQLFKHASNKFKFVCADLLDLNLFDPRFNSVSDAIEVLKFTRNADAQVKFAMKIVGNDLHICELAKLISVLSAKDRFAVVVEWFEHSFYQDKHDVEEPNEHDIVVFIDYLSNEEKIKIIEEFFDSEGYLNPTKDNRLSLKF